MKTQWRDSILVLIAILLCFWAGFRLLNRSGKATYRNRTAYEWLILASRPGPASAELMHYPDAIRTLNTDFLQVMLDCPNGGFSGRFGRWFQTLYYCSPKTLRPYFPKPLTRNEIRNCGGMIIMELGRDNCLSYLKTALHLRSEEDQSYISELIYWTAGGNSVEPKNSLDAPEFCVRLQAALYYQTRPPSLQNPAPAIPVLISALTNSAQMAETYGDHADYWRKTARKELQWLSPQTAAQYSN